MAPLKSRGEIRRQWMQVLPSSSPCSFHNWLWASQHVWGAAGGKGSGSPPCRSRMPVLACIALAFVMAQAHTWLGVYVVECRKWQTLLIMLLIAAIHRKQCLTTGILALVSQLTHAVWFQSTSDRAEPLDVLNSVVSHCSFLLKFLCSTLATLKLGKLKCSSVGF